MRERPSSLPRKRPEINHSARIARLLRRNRLNIVAMEGYYDFEPREKRPLGPIVFWVCIAVLLGPAVLVWVVRAVGFAAQCAPGPDLCRGIALGGGIARRARARLGRGHRPLADGRARRRGGDRLFRVAAAVPGRGQRLPSAGREPGAADARGPCLALRRLRDQSGRRRHLHPVGRHDGPQLPHRRHHSRHDLQFRALLVRAGADGEHPGLVPHPPQVAPRRSTPPPASAGSKKTSSRKAARRSRAADP